MFIVLNVLYLLLGKTWKIFQLHQSYSLDIGNYLNYIFGMIFFYYKILQNDYVKEEMQQKSIIS